MTSTSGGKLWNVAAAAVAVVMLTGGCTADEQPPPEQQPEATDGPAPTDPETTDPVTAAPTDGPTRSGIDVTDVTASAEEGDWPSFTSPTGNITCTIAIGEDAYAECWLAEADWAVEEPDDCEFDWMATALQVAETSTAGACRSDYPHGQDPRVLEYGQGLRVRDLQCESRETGMTCWNTGTGHGFHASRDSYRTF